MKTTIEALKTFWRDDDGLEMIEYAVLAALIIVVIAAAIPTVTGKVLTTLTSVGTSL